jgi:CMP-N-acetylneuraminic acid synthetase
MTTLVFVPARKNSVRIKNKNLKILDGKPLIYYTLKICKSLKKKFPIFISTDSEKILNYSKKKFKFYTAYIRPQYLSLKNSKIVDGISHGVEWYKRFFNKRIDHIILLQPTSPLRKLMVVKKIIDFYFNKKLESLATVSIQKDNLINHVSLNYRSHKKWDSVIKKKKNLKKKYHYFNGYLYIFSYNFLKKNKKIIVPNKTYLYETNKVESVDVDCMDDFIIAKSLI